MAITAACGLLAAAAGVAADDLATGRALTYEVNKGNCLACHSAPGDPRAVTSANIAPPFLQMRARFPQRERLYEQIRDPTQFNPDTIMPPFGKHKVLTEQEINDIVDFLYSL